MAHATDYESRINSHSYYPPSRLSQSSTKKQPPDDAYHLALNFLRSNPNWAIDSLVTYLMTTYTDFNMTHMIISRAITTYINEKS
jgi:hypothetical protein